MKIIVKYVHVLNVFLCITIVKMWEGCDHDIMITEGSL